MRKKPAPMDPRLVAANERHNKALVDFERWYQRLRRAFNRCEKARGVVVRTHRLIARLKGEASGKAATPAAPAAPAPCGPGEDEAPF